MDKAAFFVHGDIDMWTLSADGQDEHSGGKTARGLHDGVYHRDVGIDGMTTDTDVDWLYFRTNHPKNEEQFSKYLTMLHTAEPLSQGYSRYLI